MHLFCSYALFWSHVLICTIRGSSPENFLQQEIIFWFGLATAQIRFTFKVIGISLGVYSEIRNLYPWNGMCPRRVSLVEKLGDFFVFNSLSSFGSRVKDTLKSCRYRLLNCEVLQEVKGLVRGMKYGVRVGVMLQCDCTQRNPTSTLSSQDSLVR